MIVYPLSFVFKTSVLMEKIIVRRPITELNSQLPSLHPLLQRIYEGRGIASINELGQEFEHLLPYTALKGIDGAVACIYEALQQRQKITIIGDFDADGATSTALAVLALRRFAAAEVSFLTPNRFVYGYGLTPEIVEVAAQGKPSVIITVDNGISSIEGVERANQLGIKVVITDHHLPGAQLPNAAAIVNPNQHGDNFPGKNTAGVGVIFYVMLALRRYLRDQQWFVQQQIPEPNMAELLDLVALGTVADVVPLDRNNRILVQHGLRRIQVGKARPGILALLTIANRSPEKLVAMDLGFAIAPRLNAAGRLEDMSLGIECLLAEEPTEAMRLAQRLDSLNKERKDIEDSMHQHALDFLKNWGNNQNLPLGLCLHDESWHQGVIGILASRIKDRVHRPVIAFASVSATEFKGSARSIPGLHIRDALEAIASRHPQLLQRFGGHAMAAGLSLHPDNFAKFSQAFNEEVSRHLSQDDLQQKILSDGELTSADLTLDIAGILRDAGPWGQGFPPPLFDNVFTVIEQRILGTRHLKLVLGLGQQVFDAIAFNINADKWQAQRPQQIRAAYRLDINEYRGMRKLQLLVEHWEGA